MQNIEPAKEAFSSAVFDHEDYKSYLSGRFSTQGSNRGLRAKLATKLSCQSAFISQVLNSHTHFSLEHAVIVDEFLEHSPDESEYFMLLIHHGRAGTKGLKNYYRKQLDQLRKRREVISERIHVKEKLNQIDAFQYYSTWYYAAIHVLTMIPKYQTQAAIAEHLRLPLKVVKEATEFLAYCGLIEENQGKWVNSKNRIHLGNDTIITSKYHMSWRIKTLQNLELSHKEDLHYTGVLALSSENVEKLRTLVLNFIESLEPIIQEGPEEELHAISLDYYRL